MSSTIGRTSRFRTSLSFTTGPNTQLAGRTKNRTQAFGLQESRMNKLVNLLAVPALSTKSRPILKLFGASATLVAIALLLLVFKTPRVSAGPESDRDQDQSKVQIGLAIAPVPLNLTGKNRGLVGLGSYIVNAQSDCNGCHSRGPQTEYLGPGNPYLLSPPHGPFTGMQQINPATYLGGGRDFGPFGSHSELLHLYSRNLTPDKTGRPEGGHTFDEFLTIMRTGEDYDHVHPNCTGAPDGNCLLPPFNGDVLQV